MGSIIIVSKLQEFTVLITMLQPDSQEDSDQSRPHSTLAGSLTMASDFKEWQVEWLVYLYRFALFSMAVLYRSSIQSSMLLPIMAITGWQGWRRSQTSGLWVCSMVC